MGPAKITQDSFGDECASNIYLLRGDTKSKQGLRTTLERRAFDALRRTHREAVRATVINPTMNLQRIKHFVVLAETLNFRRAAERLHMAQPPLSVSIRKLEVELGTALFTRTSSGVALTPSGCTALLEARRLLIHADNLASLVAKTAAGTGGTLRIGLVGSTIYGMLQELVPAFRNEYPGVEVILHEATSARIIHLVEAEDLDLGLVRTPLLRSTRLALLMLERDELIAALPSTNPLAAQPVLKLADLAQESFVMYGSGDAAGLRAATMLACEGSGFVPRIAQEATQLQTLLAMVESGLGVALVPSIMSRFTRPGILYRPLEALASTAATGLALIHRTELESAAALRFRELAVRRYAAGASQVHASA